MRTPSRTMPSRPPRRQSTAPPHRDRPRKGEARLDGFIVTTQPGLCGLTLSAPVIVSPVNPCTLLLTTTFYGD